MAVPTGARQGRTRGYASRAERFQTQRRLQHVEAKLAENETIRIHPYEGWLEIRLPTPLAHLSNMPGRAPTYRLSCPVTFTHRDAEWAAQASSGAVRYDIFLDLAEGKGTGRWYADASWRLLARPVPSLDELRQHRSLAVDLNADHLAAWVLSPAGNPLGEPVRSPSRGIMRRQW